MLPLATVAAQRPMTLAGRSVVYAPHGIVSTSQPLATTAGLAVLQHGGNAIDAAGDPAAGFPLPPPTVGGIRRGHVAPGGGGEGDRVRPAHTPGAPAGAP